jgi:aminoglycoside/choline kinase family phosphotransferase
MIEDFLAEQNISYLNITALPISGGDRRYFRVLLPDNKTIIATYSENIAENKTFLAFTKSLSSLHLPVPAIITYNKTYTIYLQEDVGNICLLDLVTQQGYTDNVYNLYQQSLAKLATLQVKANTEIPYELCLVNKNFDADAALFDLQYCYNYFVQPLAIPINNITSLQKEFVAISHKIGSINPTFFMYRDFQGRNIMVKNNDVYFIDYQGGMQGPPAYDVASLLWQAKAALPTKWKNELLEYYITCLNKELSNTLNIDEFKKGFQFILLIRLLQVLGAYGRRGILEQKAHFLESIPYAIENLNTWLGINNYLLNDYPETKNLIIQIIQNKNKIK